MEGLIDIHAHVLPQVDDGPSSLPESMGLLKEQENAGVRTIVATPHLRFGVYENTPAAIDAALRAVRRALEQEGSSLEVLQGAEVTFYEGLVRDLKEGQIPPFAGHGKYVLLELPYSHFPHGVRQLIFELQLEGVVPIIAHPERCDGIRQHPNLMTDLVQRGALGQVTAQSLLGFWGSAVQKTALTMVEHGLVHVVAGDAHDSTHRLGRLDEGMAFLATTFGKSVAQRFQENARRIVEGKPLRWNEPTAVSHAIPKRTFWSGLRGRHHH